MRDFRISSLKIDMKCPKCRGSKFRVVDKRFKKGILYRRRMCIECGERFTTFEVVVENSRGVINSLNDIRKRQETSFYAVNVLRSIKKDIETFLASIEE